MQTIAERILRRIESSVGAEEYSARGLTEIQERFILTAKGARIEQGPFWGYVFPDASMLLLHIDHFDAYENIISSLQYLDEIEQRTSHG